MKIEWEKKVVTSGVVDSYDKVPRGAEIVGVNGRAVEGMCVTCEQPILEGQDYECSLDDVMWHKRKKCAL